MDGDLRMVSITVFERGLGTLAVVVHLLLVIGMRREASMWDFVPMWL